MLICISSYCLQEHDPNEKQAYISTLGTDIFLYWMKDSEIVCGEWNMSIEDDNVTEENL
jgi:hypothetical protein